MAEDQDPFAEFGGKTIKPTPKTTEQDPFAEFGGKTIKKKIVSTTPTSESKPFSVTSGKTSQQSKSLSDTYPMLNANMGYNAVLTPKQQKEALKEKPLTEAELAMSNRLAQIKNVYETANPNVNKGTKSAETITKGIPESERAGNRATYLYNKVLEGVGSVASGLGDVAATIAAYSPNQGYSYNATQPNVRTPEQQQEQNKILTEYRANVAPKVRDYLKDTIGAKMDKGLEAKYSNETLTGALGGLASSVPAIAANFASGGIGTGAMFLQSYDNALQSIDQTEEGRKLDDATKTFFAGGVGLVTSALEKYGLDKIFKGETGVISNAIAQKAVKEAAEESGGKITGDLFTKFLDKEVINLTNKYVKGGARALDAALVEYSTEALQEGAQAGAELLTNKATGKPVFDTSETGTWGGFIRRMNKAGVAGAIGGGLLGSVAALGGIKTSDVDDNTNKLNEINTALENDQLPDASRQVLTEEKIKVQDEIQKSADKIDATYEKLDDKQKDRVNEIVEEKVKLQEVLSDENVPESIKKSVEEQSKALDEELSNIKPISKTENESKIRERGEVQSSGSLSQEIGGEESGSSGVRNGSESTWQEENDRISTERQEEKVTTEGGVVPPSTNEAVNEVKPTENIGKEAAPKAEEAVAETGKETIKEPLTKEEQQNAIKERNVEQGGVGEHQGAIEQQQGKQENREYQKEPKPTSEAEASSSNRTEQGREVKEKVESPTALKNEDIANKRKELGLEPREAVERKSNTELVEKAKAKIKEGYDVESLIDEVVNNKKALSDEEGVMLKQYQLAKENRLVEIGDEIIKATEEGKGTALDKLIDERASLVNDIDRAFRAGEQSGTISARALQARKAAMLNDYSLANMLIQKRKAAGDGKLTPEQIEQTSKEYNKIKKLNEEFEAKVAKLEAENAKLKADKAFKGLKEFTKRESNRIRTKEQIDADINDTVGSLKKKLKEQRGKLSANAIPVDIIPEIAKLAKLYTQKGLVNLSSVVDKIYTELKDDIDNLKKEDIEELIANYDYEGEAANQRRLEAFKKRTGKRIEELRGRLENKDFYSKKKLPEIKLDKEGQELQDELRKAKYEWEKGLEQDALARRTTLEKIRDGVTEVLNLPRALMATLDYSAPLRQGLVLTISRPEVARKAFIEMFKQSASQQKFDRYLANLKESPQFPVMEKAGLYIADPHTPKLAAKEEQFMSNLAEKIPLIGKGFEFKVGDKNIKIGGLNLIGGAERAYTAYLNKLRADVFTQGADLFEKDGKTIETDPKLYEALADYVNSATGRGNLGKLENSAQVLNSMFFSPRLIASRIRLLTNWANPVWYANTPWAVKKMYIQDMGKTIAFGATILALASLAGADVEKDPRSSDFGKIRLGDTRWDIWGGFQQFVRFFTQVVTGERKNTRDKTIREINGKGFKGETRADVVLNMLRSKLSPVPAIAWNLASGKTMVGEEYGLKDVPPSFLPLFVTDLVKAVNREGADAIITQGLPGVFGVGVQTYGDKKQNVDFLKMSKSEQKKFIDDAVKKSKESMDKK